MSTSPDSVTYPSTYTGIGVPQSQRPTIMAPLRTRLTQMLGNGPTPHASFPPGPLPFTFLTIVPIEAPCYAVRLGFANPFNYDMVISKAAVIPSSTYSVADLQFTTGNPGSQKLSVVPTGSGAAATVYFDNAGADVSTINTSGSTRGLTLAANTSNPSNSRVAYTMKWSDWVPCSSIARADGGTQPLLFIYTSINGNAMTTAASSFVALNQQGYARGRYHWVGQAWTVGTDYVDNPTGTGYKNYSNLSPVYCVQYLTMNPGLQIMTTGDSITASPTDDTFSMPLWRAACDISTPSLPVALASFAWGSTDYSVYIKTAVDHLGAINPSLIAPQVISRNSMTGDPFAYQQMLLGQASLLIDQARRYGAIPMYQIGGGEPSWDGTAANQNAFLNMLSLLRSSGAMPLLDSPAVTAPLDKPWNYITGVSSDNTHLNAYGVELLVPQARNIINKMIGVSGY